MRNKTTRVITAADLPADPKPRETLVAIERSKAEAILAVLLYLDQCHEAPRRELLTGAREALAAAIAAPGMAVFRPWEFDDRLTGNRVRIEVSPQYSELQINNRHYYFYRETGEWDGTGTDFDPTD